MAFNPKAWQNAPNQTTPLSAAAMMDLETRVTNTGFGGLVSKSANYTAIAGDVVYSNPTSGGATITLPAPVASTTVTVIAGSHTSTTNPTTVAGTNITGLGLSGASSYSIYVPGVTAIFTSDGTNWYIVSNPQTLHAYNVADFGFDPNGNDVNATPWANLLAAIAADPVAQARGVRIIFPPGDYCLNNCVIDATTAISGNAMVMIEGQGNSTRIFPGGGQGQALTIKCQPSSGNFHQLIPVLRNFLLGYGGSHASPDLPYNQPLLTISQASNGPILLDEVNGFLAGTGTIVHIDASYDLEYRNSFLETGQYAVGLYWNAASGPVDSDTICLKGVQCHGEHGVVFNYGSVIETIELDECKFDAENFRGVVTAYESFLASNATVGATTITLNTGDGAHFAANDAIAIGEGMGGGASGQTGYDFEVNKVVSVASDTLTLKWPLQYAHNVSGTNPHHVQVIKGGIGLVLPQVQWAHIHDSHFEASYIGISAWLGTGLLIENATNSCNRLLRVGNALTDVTFGPIGSYGNSSLGSTENMLIDVPTWNTTAYGRFNFDGPFSNLGEAGNITLIVNYQGTTYSIDRYGWHPLSSSSFPTSVAGWNTLAARTTKVGLLLRGFARSTGAVAASTVICTLPTPMQPANNGLASVYATNANPVTTTPSNNAIEVESKGNGGQVLLLIATTAGGNLSLDGLSFSMV